MKYDFKDLYEGPRFQNRARKRKIKLIIMSIAAILGIVLIIGVINIFSGDSEKANIALEEPNETEQAVDDAQTDDETVSLEDDQEATQNDNMTEMNDSNNMEYSQDEKVDTSHSDSTKTVPNESKVVGSIEQDWEPVGTEQEGEHVTDFTKGSQDWEEMTQAVSSATGLSNDNMIVWWMGNGGAPDKASSTVSTKDKGTYYRVQLEWENGSGWKPVKVEEIEGNDQQSVTEKTDN